MLEFIAPIVGGLLGGSSSGGESSQKKELDPRIAKYVFGESGTSGLLGDASNIYKQQMATGGLNNYQRQGLDMQMQYLMSPQYQQSYQQMHNLGTSLMGGGVAGNPFNGGGGMRHPMLGQPMGQQFSTMRQNLGQAMGQQPYPGGFQYQPMPQAAPDYSIKAPAQPTVTQADFEKWLADYLARQKQLQEPGSHGDGSVGNGDGSDGGGIGDGPGDSA